MFSLLEDEDGSVLLEFTLAAILIIVFLMGIVNLAMVLRDKVAVTAAAREAARTMVILRDDPDTAGIAETKARLQARKVLGLAADNSNEDIESATIALEDKGGGVEVTVTFNEPLFFPGISGFLGGELWSSTIPVTGKAVYLYGEGEQLRQSANPIY